jgi:hypothetical protein
MLLERNVRISKVQNAPVVIMSAVPVARNSIRLSFRRTEIEGTVTSISLAVVDDIGQAQELRADGESGRMRGAFIDS